MAKNVSKGVCHSIIITTQPSINKSVHGTSIFCNNRQLLKQKKKVNLLSWKFSMVYTVMWRKHTFFKKTNTHSVCINLFLCVFEKENIKRSGRIYTMLSTVIISDEGMGLGREEENRRDKEKSLYILLNPYFTSSIT